MSKRRGSSGFRRFFSDLRRTKVGIVGLSLLILFLGLAIFFPLIGNMNDIKNWNNLQYWRDNPKAAPPCWAVGNTFKSISVTGGENTSNLIERNGELDGFKYISYSFLYNVETQPPIDVIARFNISYSKPTYVYITMERPDGKYISLTGNPESGERTSVLDLFGVDPNSYSGDIRIQLASYLNNMITIRNYIVPWLQSNNVTLQPQDVFRLTNVAFSILHQELTPNIINAKNVTYLSGKYNVTFVFYSSDKNLSVALEKAIALGGCYGIVGTDNMGRDLWMGLMYGIRWALIIGFSVSIMSVLIGGIYGVVGGYFGGKTDEIMLRTAQVFYSIPVLPILILLAVIFRPSIWNVISMLIIFGWPSTALVTRSMALQIKEETYVEAAKAIGSSSSRILFRYILPQVLPYLFASIALSVPGAILTEASLSFLGLGDPSIVTWGRILNEAEVAGATINGYWWWVLSPGLMITIVGMTFILIGQALDLILNPKLRR